MSHNLESRYIKNVSELIARVLQLPRVTYAQTLMRPISEAKSSSKREKVEVVYKVGCLDSGTYFIGQIGRIAFTGRYEQEPGHDPLSFLCEHRNQEEHKFNLDKGEIH